MRSESPKYDTLPAPEEDHETPVICVPEILLFTDLNDKGPVQHPQLIYRKNISTSIKLIIKFNVDRSLGYVPVAPPHVVANCALVKPFKRTYRYVVELVIPPEGARPDEAYTSILEALYAPKIIP